MNVRSKHLFLAALMGLAAISLSNCAQGPVTRINAATASRSEITRDSKLALASLYKSDPKALELAGKAEAVLVFPSIIKGGLMVGAEGGNGALFTRGSTSATRYYQTAGASYGLQAGVQKFGYALFLMHPGDVHNLDSANGWEIGSSPSLVVVDKGIASALTTKTIEKGVYAFFFDQKGLMAGLGLKGTKITRIHPAP